MDLSIIIVNYRGWDDLATCLDSLRPLISPEKRPWCEVIVVDNDSDDGLYVSFCERYEWVTFVKNLSNLGFASGCNLGTLSSRGEFLLFLNPDAKDPGQQIHGLWRFAVDHPNLGILTSRQTDADGRPQKVFDAFPSALNLLGPIRALARLISPKRYANARHCMDEIRTVDWVSGAAFLIRKDILQALGGWCDDYWMYCEDVDLCRRAADAGVVSGYTATLTLEHRHGTTSRRNPETAALTRTEVIISKHLYAHRHLGRWQAWLFHALLVTTRLPLPLMAWLIERLWPDPPMALIVRALMARHLIGHYRHVLTSGDWRSRRAAWSRQCASDP